MKKAMIIFASLLIMTSAFAFEKGTMNLGGTASLSMAKSNSDDETLTTIIMRPQFGYFVADNVCVDGIFIYESQSYDDESTSAIGVGLGGRYFYNNFYGGMDLQFQSMSMEDDALGDFSVSANYLQPKIGVLVPLNPNVFLDFGASYQFGFGDYGGDRSGTNESTRFNFNVGLHYFFKR
ncbi:MAG: hypothetical protein PHQ78_08650 [Candidatus Cloacimonetes bacterium]|nr:hypothetical protein [Candidatus Cloacimonadota bacterium]